MYIANEGKMIAIVSNEIANDVIKEWRKSGLGKEAEIIGEVTSENPGTVVMKTTIGSKRIVDMITGEQLPRIC